MLCSQMNKFGMCDTYSPPNLYSWYILSFLFWAPKKDGTVCSSSTHSPLKDHGSLFFPYEIKKKIVRIIVW